MKGFSKYFFLVWATGVGVTIIFAFSTGQQDWEAERDSALKRVGQLSASLRLSLENLTEKTANELTRIIEVELVSSGLTHWLSESSFQSIAMLGRDDFGNWQVEWAKSKTPGDVYVKAQYEAWKGGLPLDAIQGETLSWNIVRYNTTPPRKMLLLGVQLKVKAKQGESYKIAFGLLPLNYLTSLTEPLKADGDEVFIVDRAGRALTYPDPQYLGSNLDVHDVVKALKKSQKLSDFRNFKNLSGDATVGGYERSKNSNAYIVANQKVQTRQSAILAVAQSGVMGLGLVILLSLITIIFEKSDRNRVRQMAILLRKGQDGSKSSAEPASSSDIEKERRELFEQLGLTFLTHLRGPVYSSLGKMHKLTAAVKDAEQKKDVAFVEKEIRRIRDFIEGLGQTFDLDARPSERIDLSATFEKHLTRYRSVLQKREIQLEFEPHANAWLKMSRDDLDFILRTMMDTVLDKLTFSGDQKKLQVKIEKMGGMNRLALLVMGAKFPVAEVETMFLIRDRENLELSFARGFALSWNGNLSAESSILGARFFLEIPAVETEIKEEVKAMGQEKKEEPVFEQAAEPEAPPAEPLATQVTTMKEDTLSEKRVTDELNKVLPPTPAPASKTEVSVVEDLTASTEASLNLSPDTQTATEADGPPDVPDDPMEVKIRKPKVRFDV